ncbi:non-homologous end-joining DNA ligase [Rhabdothermincola sediminis]|uniref:non-homologous end-joining DNA ligase n=1 Tax=Rhabdothermincola sediminis TaxID=2751370 RepID=UPI001AA05503|nr:non-homologous end-joining DNA ligase [Rhabdothermincola sediminis]
MGTTTPQRLAPMRAVLVDAVPDDDDQWSYEIKWDGMRAIAVVEHGELRLHTANLLDATDRFPELQDLAAAIAPHTAVLDGEIVALDGHGIPDFGRLQPRIQARSPASVQEAAARQPVVYVLFDLLALDGRDLTSLPYEQRRSILRDLIAPGPAWRVTDAWTGGGRELLEVMRDRGLEGLIAKRLGSHYEPGRRSSAWRKLKVRQQQELVVGGWLPGKGARAASFGALLVGYVDGPSLRYAGRVGTGFDDRELHELRRLLDARSTDRCPFDPPPPAAVRKLARWAEPTLVVEVAFREWTSDGILRQPVYLGQRIDKDASQVVRERA